VVGRECFAKTDIGENGQACATMVCDSVKDGELVENYLNGEVAGGNG